SSRTSRSKATSGSASAMPPRLLSLHHNPHPNQSPQGSAEEATLHRARRLIPTASIAALAVLAPSASASAPGWSTPHTASSFRIGTYAAMPNGQGVQVFGNGAAQTMTAQLRAIKSDATQGTAVGVNAGAPGFDGPRLSVNANGRFVAAWLLDTQEPGPIGI